MRCWLPLLLFVCLAPVELAGQAATPAPPKLNRQILVGTWQYVSGESGGKPAAAERLANQSVVITEKSLTLKGIAGDFVMDYDLDVTTSPAGLSCKITSSPFGQGSEVKGIIALAENGILKICYAHEGDAPREFTSEADDNHRMLKLKRKSP